MEEPIEEECIDLEDRRNRLNTYKGYGGGETGNIGGKKEKLLVLWRIETVI